MTTPALTRQKDRAAQLLGQTSMTRKEVASEVGVAAKTLERWFHTEPIFKEAITKYEAQQLADNSRMPFTRRFDRVAKLSDEMRRIERIRDSRATKHWDDPKVQEDWVAAGGLEGWHTWEKKNHGSGEFMEFSWIFRFDVALYREYRETMKQLAIELGQWENVNVDPVNASISVIFSERSDGPQRQEGAEIAKP